MIDKNFVFGDIGNTRIKLLEGEVLNSYFITQTTIDEIAELLKNKIFLYSSVNKTFESNLLSKLVQLNIRYRTVSFDEIRKLINFDNVDGMGKDRLLGLCGAISFQNAPIITIDCGSCMTINVMNEQNEVLGGTITAGLITQLEALRRINEVLYPKMFTLKKNIPINTNDAVFVGTLNSLVGAVKEFLTDVFERLEWEEEKVKIIIVGGYKDLIAERLKQSTNYKITEIDNLVVYGIKKVFESIAKEIII